MIAPVPILLYHSVSDDPPSGLPRTPWAAVSSPRIWTS